ncbi:MAG TPA: type II toxin-antitoxin system prevent-host-death family antitoxin [Terriglobia bacterium]|nr:type II toxin-antitoxin system prevent-host-death family antitoxin [Terriglobia bacterium]
MKVKAEQITATEFKARCLKMLDELGPQGVIVTKRGRPVARVVPILAVDNSGLIGCLKGRIKVNGQIFSTGVKWNAQS